MNKEERKKLALEHVRYTKSNYSDDTRLAIGNSTIYDECNFDVNCKITVEPITTQEAIFKFGRISQYDCCALNFASYKYPGGGFLNGSMAQEEALCHSSNLYDILESFKSIYEDNKKHLNDGLYTNRAIWCSGVMFVDNNGNASYADIITCAAPNLNAYTSKHTSMDDIKKYEDTMISRCKYVLDIANHKNVENLILGAFGCGVFGNDPRFVATTFKKLLDKGKYNFKNVVFAIPNKQGYNDKYNNYEIFKQVFK